MHGSSITTIYDHDDLRLRAWAEELLTGIPADEVEYIDGEPIYGDHLRHDDDCPDPE